jgi:hypothetical protein
MKRREFIALLGGATNSHSRARCRYFLTFAPHDTIPFFYVIPFTLGIHEAW